jgi:hypothetical protein
LILLPRKSVPVSVLTIVSVITLGLIWTGTHAIDERMISVRYLLFALSGFIAFATPYLFFPDEKTPLLQLANQRGNRFIGYLLMKMWRFYFPLILFLGVVLFGDLNSPAEHLTLKTGYLLYAVFFTAGLNFFALSRYIRSGGDSQFWQESEKGRELRRKAADYLKYPVDPGSVPSLINTILITSAGMAFVILVAAAGGESTGATEAVSGGIIMLLGLYSLFRIHKKPERFFYTTNAFYREFFGTGQNGDSVTERRRAGQLWWVPAPIRADVWQYLQQIDRKIPAGRVVIAGHMLVWLIAYQRPDEPFLATLWGLFALLHHLFILMTFRSELSPAWLLRWLGSSMRWFWVRFWMQLRWLVPLWISMSLQLFLFGTPGWYTQGMVIAVFLIAGMILSAAGAIQIKRDIR